MNWDKLFAGKKFGRGGRSMEDCNHRTCPNGHCECDDNGCRCVGGSVLKTKKCDSPPCTCSPACGRGLYCNTSEGICQPATEVIKK